jgi:SAM-dependent methyltransferase
MDSTRRYFEKHAQAADRLYDDRGVLAPLRRGPRLGRDLAAAVVARQGGPAVLDVGCGPGRVAEAVLDAGAASYVGIDLSPRMLALARRRLQGRERVELIEGDFLELELGRRFPIVLALGLFDYLEQSSRAAGWLRAHCTSTLVASFTRWDWVKGPIRHARYRLERCPLVDYDEERTEALLLAAGFSRVSFSHRGHRGFLAVAGVAPPPNGSR